MTSLCIENTFDSLKVSGSTVGAPCGSCCSRVNEPQTTTSSRTQFVTLKAGPTLLSQILTQQIPPECSRKAFDATYSVGQVLGNGGFGTVYSARRRHDKLQVVVKFVDKERVLDWVKKNGRFLPLEVALLETVAHIDGCIRLLDHYEEPQCFLFVMERPVPSEDLFDYITRRGCLSETEARKIMRQTVSILMDVHEAGVFHRDIKDENILINPHTGKIKLIDFGSGAFACNNPYRSFGGTKVYSPPEWLQLGVYEAYAATVWSLGILMYDMVMGDIPFETEEAIKDCTIVFRKKATPELRELIRWCLEFQPLRRPTLQQIFNHRWMQSNVVAGGLPGCIVYDGPRSNFFNSGPGSMS